MYLLCLPSIIFFIEQLIKLELISERNESTNVSKPFKK
jgi:hypothetical protein